MAETLIYVPNRRSARRLAACLFQKLGGGSFIPPDIRPLGDVVDTDTLGASDLAFGDGLPEVSDGHRLGVLTRLILAWQNKTGAETSMVNALRAAQELAGLLDQAALVGDVDWHKLGDLAGANELAQHWQSSIDFLKIVTEAWPDYLADNGLAEPARQRVEIARTIAARWEANPPDHPVIIAGSTGTTPASRLLMEAIAKLPKGLILFEGLERDAQAQAWEAIRQTPSHPQFAFAGTLDAMGLSPEAVASWPGYAETDKQTSRRKLIEEALAPAETTDDWLRRLKMRADPQSPEELTRQALENVFVIEAENEAEEAFAIALKLRETLETPDKTAALVTADAGLAKRVSASLRRWEIDAPTSAGRFLTETRAGSFLFLAAGWMLDPGDPVLLCALLKHEVMTQEDTAVFTQADISQFERTQLRGPRLWHGLDSLQRYIADEGRVRRFYRADEASARIVSWLQTVHAPCVEPLAGPLSGEAFAGLLAGLLQRLSDGEAPSDAARIWADKDGAAIAGLLETLADTGHALGEEPGETHLAILEALADGDLVANETAGHPRIAILGPLEARLQSADLVILGGLNEGSWPGRSGGDAFLPRHFRSRIGLPDPEARVGLAAHDFAQLAGSGEVILSRSKRLSDKPSVASRWLWRLRILASGAVGSMAAADELLALPASTDPLLLARSFHAERQTIQVRSPEPRPPKEARKRDFSVTQVGAMIRDPYSVYAGKILELETFDPLDAEIGPPQLGTAVHKGLELFEADIRNENKNTAANLVGLIETVLKAAGLSELQIRKRHELYLAAAQTYLDWRLPRLADYPHAVIEKKVSQIYNKDGVEIALKGTPDLVEVAKDGSFTVLDFKTGAPKSQKQVSSGLEPQLPLLAALIKQDNTDYAKAQKPADLLYFRFGSNAKASSVADDDPAALGERELQRFLAYVAKYVNDPKTAYLSRPRVYSVTDYGEYDRLARVEEWRPAD